MRRKTWAIIVVVVVGLLAFFFFAPVVPLTAGLPGTGGYHTTITNEGNTTRTITLVGTPAYDQGLGSMTYCFLGEGSLLVNGGFYPLARPSLQFVGAFCPAISAP